MVQHSSENKYEQSRRTTRARVGLLTCFGSKSTAVVYTRCQKQIEIIISLCFHRVWTSYCCWTGSCFYKCRIKARATTDSWFQFHTVPVEMVRKVQNQRLVGRPSNVGCKSLFVICSLIIYARCTSLITGETKQEHDVSAADLCIARGASRGWGGIVITSGYQNGSPGERCDCTVLHKLFFLYIMEQFLMKLWKNFCSKAWKILEMNLSKTFARNPWKISRIRNFRRDPRENFLKISRKAF